MDSEDIKELESIVKQKDQELIDLALEGFKSWEDGARSKALWRLLKYDKAVAIDATKRMLERDQSSSIGEILEKSHTTKHKDFEKKILTKIGHLRNIEDKHAINGISLLINRYLSYSRIADRVCFPPKQYKLRIEATKALLNFGLKDVIVFLEDSLINDKSIRVRKLASLMLAKIRQLKGAENKRKRNELSSLIDSYIKDGFKLSAASLMLLHKYEITDLDEILLHEYRSNKDITVKRCALLLMAKLKNPKVASFLFEELQRIDDVDLGLATVDVLAKLRDPRAVNYLWEKLEQTDDPALRFTLICKLSRLGDPRAAGYMLEELKRNSNAKITSPLLAVIAKLRDPRAVNYLWAKLEQTDDPALKRSILFSFKRHHLSGKTQRIEVLYRKEADEIARKLLIKALRYVDEEDSLGLLKEAALNDQSEKVRKAAAVRLGSMKNNEALTLLSRALKDKRNKDLKKDIVAALRGKGKHLYSTLLDLLETDDDQGTKIEAVKNFLGRTEDTRIFDHLLKIIETEECVPFKVASIGALQKVGGFSATAPLLKLLNDECRVIRVPAAEALAYLGEPSAFSSLVKELKAGNETDDMRPIIRALGVLGDKRAVPYIIDQLCKGDSGIKRASIVSLGLLGDKQAIPYLKELLKDETDSIRIRAAIVLGYFKVKGAYKTICEALESTSAQNRASALRSLAVLNGKKDIDLIISALGDHHPRVRERALNVFIEVATNEVAFLAQYMDSSSLSGSKIHEDEFPKAEVLNALKADYFKEMRVDVNSIEENIIYRILLLIDNTQSEAEIMQKLDALRNQIKSEEGSRLHFFQRQEYTSEEIIIDDNWFDRILDTHAMKNHYNTRPKQQVFRERVIKRYGAYCAVCGMRVPELLAAAHIIPKESKGIDDPRNGIVLCSLHHKAFDSNLFGIERDSLEIHYRPGGPNAGDLKIRYGNIGHLHKKPHPDVLKWRWNYWHETLSNA